MISKPLLKQSCKANGIMWIIITFAVCFMLACVMIIGGNGDISLTKNAIQDQTIKGELEAQTQKRGINYYEMSQNGLMFFDSQFVTEYTTTNNVMLAYQNACGSMQDYCKNVAMEVLGEKYSENAIEVQEITGLIMYTLNPMVNETSCMFDDFYIANNAIAPRYDFQGALTETQEERQEYIKDYAFTNSSIFLAGNMISEDNVKSAVSVLEEYNVTIEKYKEFGYTDFDKIMNIAREAVLTYRSNLEYRVDNIKDGETVDGIKAELNAKFSTSFLSSLPEAVSDALRDIGSMDLYGILVGSIFYKIAGLLLPIIYMIMVSNNLIAGQVDSGSMAYILSTPTKRETVSLTQMLFLVGSLLLMFILTTITSIVCFEIVEVDTTLNIGKLILINLGAFVVMFAMSGIAFLASSWFNRSKHAMAIGGGLNIFFLVATILGLFGTSIIPKIIRMEELNFFNYVSIISLFDVVSILDLTLTFLWKYAILIAIGVICYVISFIKYKKKDLPL
ncbi:MAG: ABC transporter permease subunit [Firmicutes bacterium]|nr:ABC transporter permease subunit [Candidatus Caballimonas caccae]